MELTISNIVDGGEHRSLAFTGSLDLATREAMVGAATSAMAAPGASSLAIDMSGVTFMDSSGIGGLVRISSDAGRAGIAFSLEQPSDGVRRILELTGLLDRWTDGTN